MSTVFIMRFNEKQAALLADESTWHLGFKYGYRRSNYGDHILQLLDAKDIERTRSVAVYAGVGFPCYHFEVTQGAQKALHACDPATFLDFGALSDLVFREYQKVHSRMVDDLLRFLFGFGRDEFNALTFRRDGRENEICQESVIQEARKFMTYQVKTDNMRRVFENSAAVIGFTPKGGVQGYYLSPKSKGMDFAYALTVLGEGGQIAAHVFGEVAHTMDLPSRRQGFSLEEGLALLLTIGVNTKMFQGKMGGYYQLALIDGEASSPEKMLVEISDHRLKLASEVACGFSWEFLNREAAVRLIHAALLENPPFEEAEREMFAQASDAEALQRCLMGYKPEHSRFTRPQGTENTAQGEEHDIHKRD